MNQPATTLARILTYSGTLPLIASVVALGYPIDGVNAARIAIAYGAVILSFLCGIHWAVCLFFAEISPRHLLISSNGIALLGWWTVLSPDTSLCLLLQAIGFIYLLVCDITLHARGIYPYWFYRLRCHATFIVVVCLACVMGLS